MQNRPPLSEGEEREWEEWLSHPITKQFRLSCAAKRASIKAEWEKAGFACPSQFEMICANIEAQAMCKALSLLEEMDYHSILQEVEDGQSKWFETSGASGISSTL